MNMSEYQDISSRTAPVSNPDNMYYLLSNYSMGLCGEAGEVTDYLKKVIFHEHQLDRDNVKKELGDVLWYLSQIASLVGLDLDDVAASNIDKLKKRYPNGFTSEKSINRVE